MAVEHLKLLGSLRCAMIVHIAAYRREFAVVCRKNLPKAMTYSSEPLAGTGKGI